MEAMIQIGADPITVETIGKVILQILENKANNDQKTLELALETLRKSASADYTTITDCTLYGDYKPDGKTGNQGDKGADPSV